MPTGKVTVSSTLAADGQVTLKAAGKQVAEGKFPGLILRKPGEGLTVGNDGQSAVGDYTGPHPFSGKVTHAVITTP